MTSQSAAGHDLKARPPRAMHSRIAVAATGLFFVLVFVYALWVIDPRLLYHAYLTKLPGREGWLIFPEFFVGWDFLRTMLQQPGGPAEYVGAGLSQLFYYDYLGAIILTGVTICAFFTTRGIATTVSGRRSELAPFAAPVLLLVIWNQYSFHLADQLALLITIAAVRVHVGLRRPRVRAVSFLLGSAVLYLVAGGAYLLAAAICGLVELWRRRTASAIGCFAIGALTPLIVGYWLLGTGVVAAYARLTGLYPLESPIEYFGGIRQILASVALGGAFIGMVVALTRRRSADAEPPAEKPAAAGERLRQTLTIAICAALSVGLLFVTYDRSAGLSLRVNYYSKRRMWDQLLDFAWRHPSADMEVASRRQINRALFETGQLGSRMFSFRQTPDSLLPSDDLDIGSGHEDDLLAIGSINRAEALASESLTLRGPTPHTLRVLAIVFMAKRETEAAKVFLNHLTRDIVHRPWARGYLRRLAQDPQLPDDPEIQHIRRLMQTEVAIDHGPGEGMDVELRRLIEANEGNRMALEYLTAHCLLTSDLDGVMACLERGLAGAHYDGLPTHCAEAIVIQAGPAGRPFEVGGLTVDESTAALGRRASEILAQYRRDRRRLAEAMASAMPGSYFRYFYTGQSGGGEQ